jgi:hypothetical protein
VEAPSTLSTHLALSSTPSPDPPSLPDLIARYAAGEALQALASEAHIHRVTLYRWMLTALGDQGHHDLVTECLVHRIADADHNLAVASDMCNVTRAREQAKFARMDLERRRPHLYGPRHAISSETSITVHVNRDRGKPQGVDIAPARQVSEEPDAA